MGRFSFHVVRIRPGALLAALLVTLLVVGAIAYGLIVRFAVPRATGDHDGDAPVGGEALPATTIPLGVPAPDFSLPTPDGAVVELATYEGRPVVLLFWATWCPDCARDLPRVERVFRDWKTTAAAEAQPELLAVNIMESAHDVSAFAQEHDLPWTFLLDGDAAVSDAYFVRITPTVYLVDGDGIVRARLLGPVDEDTFAARLRSLL